MIERAAETVPLTTNGLPPVATDATIPPPSITHFYLRSATQEVCIHLQDAQQ
jgi:hypothetical protein